MCWNETDRKSGGKEKVDEKVDLERMTQSGVSMRNPGGVPCSKGSNDRPTKSSCLESALPAGDFLPYCC